MGLDLPGPLADLLADLGYNWPKTDEEKLFTLGRHWMDFGGKVGGIAQDATTSVSGVWTDNHGDAIESFRTKWQDHDSALALAQDGQTGAQVLGMSLFACAGIVLALKINVIIQLGILLAEIIEAIATVEVTFGASLLEIPVFKKLADMAINLIINEAMEAILG